MTSSTKHVWNAAMARRELGIVKAQATELVCGLVSLVKAMYIFGDLDGMTFDGKPVDDVVSELLAAESVSEMLVALRAQS